MNIPLIDLTRHEANQILDAWKRGVVSYPEHVIRLALYRTGDLKRIGLGAANAQKS